MGLMERVRYFNRMQVETNFIADLKKSFVLIPIETTIKDLKVEKR